MLLNVYEARSEIITSQRYLWYGTSVKETSSGLMPIININARGFNRYYGGVSTGMAIKVKVRLFDIDYSFLSK